MNAALYSLLALTFLHPFGDGNEIVPNSFTIANGGQYQTEDDCHAAGNNTPEVLLNLGNSYLIFHQTHGCIQTVDPSQAGAYMTVGAAMQYDGFRIQVSDKTAVFSMADLGTCNAMLESITQVNPAYVLDDGLILYGKCDASGLN